MIRNTRQPIIFTKYPFHEINRHRLLYLFQVTEHLSHNWCVSALLDVPQWKLNCIRHCAFEKNNGKNEKDGETSSVRYKNTDQSWESVLFTILFGFTVSPLTTYIIKTRCTVAVKTHTNKLLVFIYVVWPLPDFVVFSVKRSAIHRSLYIRRQRIALCLCVLKPEAASLVDAAASSLNKYEEPWRTAKKPTQGLERVLAWLTVCHRGVWTKRKAHPSYSLVMRE